MALDTAPAAPTEAASFKAPETPPVAPLEKPFPTLYTEEVNKMDELNKGEKMVPFQIRTGTQATETDNPMLVLGADPKDPHRLVMAQDSRDPSKDTVGGVSMYGKKDGLFNATTGEKIEVGTVLKVGDETVTVTDYNPETRTVVFAKGGEVALPEKVGSPAIDKAQRLSKSNAKKPWMVALPLFLSSLVGKGTPADVNAPAMPEQYIPNQPPVVEQGTMPSQDLLKKSDMFEHHPKPGTSFQGLAQYEYLKQLYKGLKDREEGAGAPVPSEDEFIQNNKDKATGQEYEAFARELENSMSANNRAGFMTRTESGDFSFNSPDIKAETSDVLLKRAQEQEAQLAQMKANPAPVANAPAI